MKKFSEIYGDKAIRKSAIVAVSIFLAVIILFNVAMAIIQDKFGVIINSILTGDNVDTSGSEEVFAHADGVVRQAAAESMVLLENKDGFLPQTDLKKVNLFGWGSTEYGFLLTGGGSGGTTITDEKDIKIDLNDAFELENIEYNKDLYQAYCDFKTFDADFRTGGSTGANVVDSLLNPEASFYTDELMTSAKAYSPVAVAVLSRWGAENGGSGELKNISSSDNSRRFSDGTYLELTVQEKAMFDALENHGFQVIVVLNVCNNIELGFVKDYSCIKACIFAGIPGQSGATAIPQIITGKINPSGKTGDILPYDYQTNNPTYANTSKRDENLVYQEGIYYGYKWYETADVEGLFNSVTNKYGTGYDGVVQYPFGYGLSYTTFSHRVTFPSGGAVVKDGKYEVKVLVENTGSEEGKDVVQLYGHVDYLTGGIERPERILLDFAKTKSLKPGEKQEVTLNFTTYQLAAYDDYDKNNNGFCGYEIDGGNQNVRISVQTDSHRVVEDKKFSVSGNIRYETDPITTKTVTNRFTGSSAYANCPIDGSTAYKSDKIEYLSRSNSFANLDKIKSYGRPSDMGAVTSAANYRYDGYNDKDVSEFEYGLDLSLYLVMVVPSGNENAAPVKANIDQLSGKATDVTLKINREVAELFTDYDSEYWDWFLNQLTQDEICRLVGSGGFKTIALESIGKTLCKDKDGPAGFNDNVTSAGKPSVYPLYPSESLLGCSWSREINYAIGEAQGKIGTEVGINGWYGPGVNLHRSVYNSRNYEYYSEDGTLSGVLAAETVKGAKDNNLYCYVKHMAVSEAGENPKNLNTWLTEQSFRENYLKPFEIVVKEGKTIAIMSAFNCVGAVLSGYNHAMLTDVLRYEWGFRGTVITDWYTGSGYMSDFVAGILGGNDLWLAGTGEPRANFDFSNPAVAYAARQSAKNILYTYVTTLVSSTNLKVNATKVSPIFGLVWAFIDLLLVGGAAFYAVRLYFTYKAPKAVADGAVADSPEDNSAATSETAADEPATEEVCKTDVSGENPENGEK